MVGAAPAETNSHPGQERRSVLDHQHCHFRDLCLLSGHDVLVHLPVLAKRRHLGPRVEGEMHQLNSSDLLLWSHQSSIRHRHVGSAIVGHMAFADAHQTEIACIRHLWNGLLVSHHVHRISSVLSLNSTQCLRHGVHGRGLQGPAVAFHRLHLHHHPSRHVDVSSPGPSTIIPR